MKRKTLVKLITAIAIVLAITVPIVLAATLIPFPQTSILSNAPVQSYGGNAWQGISFTVPPGATNSSVQFSFMITGATPTSNASNVYILLSNQTNVQLQHTAGTYNYPVFGPIIYNSTKISDSMDITLGPGSYALSMIFAGSAQSQYLVNMNATLYFTAPLIGL